MNNETYELPAEVRIRRMAEGEQQLVSEILGSAFSEDPVLNWLCQNTALYPRFFYSEANGLYREQGMIYINEAETGAAMWLPPGVSAETPFEWSTLGLTLRMLVSGGLKSLQRSGQMMDVMKDNHISEPHYYLRSIGAALGEQGRGIGSALLREGLKACDAEGAVAYLESSNERNNVLYERYGFRVTGDYTFADGPTVWFMKRDAQR